MPDSAKWTTWREGNFSLLLLLIVLVVMLMIVPLFEHYFFSHFSMNVALIVIMILGVAGSRKKRSLFTVGLLTAALIVGMNIATIFVDSSTLFVFSCVLESAFFTAMAIYLLMHVVRRHVASFQSIFGAICVYLLLGLAWAMLYWSLERVDSESLLIENRIVMELANKDFTVTAFSQIVYFSFVTMTSLGYGDITPETPVAQTLAWMQSVTGQFYLAILVARLVAVLPRQELGGNAAAPAES